jgi:hypothetical protein
MARAFTIVVVVHVCAVGCSLQTHGELAALSADGGLDASIGGQAGAGGAGGTMLFGGSGGAGGTMLFGGSGGVAGSVGQGGVAGSVGQGGFAGSTAGGAAGTSAGGAAGAAGGGKGGAAGTGGPPAGGGSAGSAGAAGKGGQAGSAGSTGTGGQGGSAGSTGADCAAYPNSVAFTPAGSTQHCYWLVKTAAAFGDAAAQCVSKGAALASVHSAAENAFISGLRQGAADDIWLGATDGKAPGDQSCDASSYQWVTGEAFTFKNFSDNNPDCVCSGCPSCYCQHRAAMIGDGTWRDRNESDAYFFVCEVGKALP